MYQYINVEAVSCTSALTCDALENKSSALWGITNTKPKPKPTKQKSLFEKKKRKKNLEKEGK